MLDLADLQRSAGHIVNFFAMADEQHNIPATYADFFPSYTSLDPPPADLIARVKTFRRMVWSTEAERGMARTIAAYRPDVVHLHTIYHQLSPSILRPLSRQRIPAVMTVHDSKLVCPTYARLDHGKPCDACLRGNLLASVRRRCKNDSLLATAALTVETAIHRALGAYSPISIFICPSRFMENSMRTAKVFPERLRYVPHFFDTSSLSAREGAGDGIVVAARLSPEKGVHLVIDAMAELPDARLTIVGDGPLEATLRERASQVAGDRIAFVGRKDRQTVLAFLRSARVAIVPSLCYENAPLAIIEAMGSGVAPIVTNLGGSPEMVQDGRTGWIIEPTVSALVATMRTALEDPASAVAMGRAARRYVQCTFDPQLHLQRVLDAYGEAGAHDNR